MRKYILLLLFMSLSVPCYAETVRAIQKTDGGVAVLYSEDLNKTWKTHPLKDRPYWDIDSSSLPTEDREFWKVENGVVSVDQAKKQEWESKQLALDAENEAIRQKLKLTETEWAVIDKKTKVPKKEFANG